MQERDKFVLKSKYQPTGDQPKAIKELVESIRAGVSNTSLSFPCRSKSAAAVVCAGQFGSKRCSANVKISSSVGLDVVFSFKNSASSSLFRLAAMVFIPFKCLKKGSTAYGCRPVFSGRYNVR